MLIKFFEENIIKLDKTQYILVYQNFIYVIRFQISTI